MSKRKIDNLRHNSDEIVSKVDEQALRNFELNLELNNYKSELIHALNRVNEHTYCPGQVPIDCMDKKPCGHEQSLVNQAQSVKQQEVVHGDDCHCSKCCPNPNPNFFQKHRVGILITVIWLMMILLGVGWTPQGAVAESINTSWVELFVNIFKIGMFAIAGIATYQLTKRKGE